MKKFALTLIALMALMAVQAQDTVVNERLDNYFYNCQMDWGQSIYYTYEPVINDSCGVEAKEFYAPKGESLNVAGIAVAMINFIDYYGKPNPSGGGWVLVLQLLQQHLRHLHGMVYGIPRPLQAKSLPHPQQV